MGAASGRPLRIAWVAGELSGDILGGAIIEALRHEHPDTLSYGVAGPRMIAAGCEPIESIDALSVMGLAEVLRELPRLLRLRRALVERLLRERPDVVVGIDAPDFNLGLERRLREAGIRTIHVVSPTVWAWRRSRVKTIARAVDRILCLFPFEPAFYAGYGVAADFIGHPLADTLEANPDPQAVRGSLGLVGAEPVVAVMPGSRGSEIRYLSGPFAQAAKLIAEQVPQVRFVTPVAKPALRAAIEAAIAEHAPGCRWQVVDGRSREVMQAADVVLLASGTATLEALLLGRPMVVAYRGAALTAFLMLKLGLLKTRHVSLPNLLADAPVVPELLQDEARPDRLAAEVTALLTDAAVRQRQVRAFDAVRGQLRCGAAQRAARAIADLAAQGAH